MIPSYCGLEQTKVMFTESEKNYNEQFAPIFKALHSLHEPLTNICWGLILVPDPKLQNFNLQFELNSGEIFR